MLCIHLEQGQEICLMPGAQVRVDHAQKGLNNHRLSLQEIVVKWVKGSDLWGDNRNVRGLQSDTKSLAPGSNKRTPSHFPEDRFGTRSCAAGHWVLLGHSFCVCTTYFRAGCTERQGWTPGRCLCGKMP